MSRTPRRKKAAPAPTPPVVELQPEAPQEAPQEAASPSAAPTLDDRDQIALDLLLAFGKAIEDKGRALTELARRADPSAKDVMIPLPQLLEVLQRFYLALVLPHQQQLTPAHTMRWSLNLIEAHMTTLERQRRVMMAGARAAVANYMANATKPRKADQTDQTEERAN